MEGYIQNKTHVWNHCMKRAVRPGGKIDLDDLYEQYGGKHDLKEGAEFVEWLKNVKLKDTSSWKIVFEGSVSENETKDDKITNDIVEVVSTNSDRLDKAIRHMDVKDVVGLSVRKARDIVPVITDIKLLKYALQEANQLSGKDSLCIILRKRINELAQFTH